MLFNPWVWTFIGRGLLRPTNVLLPSFLYLILMKNKVLIVILTATVLLICLYSLSFTGLSWYVQRQATVYATDSLGQVDAAQRERYLDSLGERSKFNLMGQHYTYQQVREKELNLGLDLRGGMYVVLQVSPVKVLDALSGHSTDTVFRQALQQAERRQKSENQAFLPIFYRTYRQLAPYVPLRTLFANARNQDDLAADASDQAVLTYLQQEIDQAVDRSFEIIRNRIDEFGVAQSSVQRLPSTERIQLELPRVTEPARIRKLLQGIAHLEFRRVMAPDELMEHWQRAGEYWLSQHHNPPPPATDTVDATLEQQLLSDPSAPVGGFPLTALATNPYRMTYALQDTATINRTLAELQLARQLPTALRFVWDAKPYPTDNTLTLYAVSTGKSQGALAGDVVVDATQEFEENEPSVFIQMNTEGARKWKRMTAESIGEQIAIVLDNQVYSAPVVRSEIPDGRSSISGNFTIEEAQDLANVLKAGKMPTSVQIIEEATVGPSLGQEAIQQGLATIAGGLSLIVVFMILYYGGGGLVATGALLLNLLFILGALAQLGASLTLPGIAGLVLTIGMSVDANVLIFERIKEELSLGMSLPRAVQRGYDKAHRSIIDSNVTTFLTGLVLYLFGSGGIKGFAVVLMIGIVFSYFTAVFISRLIIEQRIRRGRSLNFGTALFRPITRRYTIDFDFLRTRKWAYGFSALIIGVGMLSIVLQGGVSLGVDFTGGRSYVVRFDEPVASDQVRASLVEAFEGGGVEVKTFNQPHQLKITTSYQASDHSEATDRAVEQALARGLEPFANEHPQTVSTTKVGATIAQDVKEAAQSAVVYTLVIIFLYILVRFHRWQYGLAAVVALFHDVLMVFAAYGLACLMGLTLEVDQVFIAAVLTLIGYSINDTVVVFDRIREFSQRSPGSGVRNIFNQAINDTLSRTVITSLTVVLVVGVLLLFGGEVLRGFSFALLVGVVVGTYSSIFIAAPLVLDMSNWHFGKRRATDNKQLTRA